MKTSKSEGMGETFLQFLDMAPPVIQVFLIILGSLILEDLTIVTTATLMGTGVLSPAVFFIGNFLGITLGDLMLYAMGRGVINWKRVSENQTLQGLQRMAAQNPWGTFAILFLSRVLPGTRVPVNIACGLARYPLPLFMLATVLAVIIWVSFFQSLSQYLAQIGRLDSPDILVVVLAILGAYWIISRLGSLILRLFNKYQRKTFWSTLRKNFYFEFWPAHVFYFPVVFWYTWLSLRYRGFLTPAYANPGIFAGGLIGESKAMIYNLLDSKKSFVLKYMLLNPENSHKEVDVQEFMKRHALSFPVIVKPDSGLRGSGVQLVRDKKALQKALHRPYAQIVQEYCAYDHEVGIFYARHPKDQQGKILSLTVKKFPFICGDGVSTIGELIASDPRASLIADIYLKRYEHRLEDVLPKGETLRLVHSGNHAQGTIFEDGKDLISKNLVQTVDTLAKSIPGFYVGRFDIRFKSFADLEKGKNFKIIEINGAGAEATHIYDKHMTLWGAYQSLFNQWSVMFKIGSYNRSRVTSPLSLRVFLQTWRTHRKNARLFPHAS